MTTAVPRIFDRALSRLRRRRALLDMGGHDFLMRAAAEEMQARLETLLTMPAGDAMVSGFVDLPDRARLAARVLRRTPLEIDEENSPVPAASLDLYVSILTLHTLNDLPGALIQIRRSLRPGGRFMAALFGARTLMELRSALSEAELEIDGGISPRVHPFVDVRDAGALLQRAGFEEPVADNYDVPVVYKTPMRLLLDLRGMGETNVLVERRKGPLRRAALARALESYVEKFSAEGGVSATFEFLFMSGRARD